ncbi:hypothetical protein D9M73_282020 [compost metagenome]
MDLGEDLRIFVGALGFQESLATFDGLAGLLENADHVEVAAATQAQQQHFHGAYTQVASTTLRRAIHHYHMTATRLAEKHGFASPLDACLHRQDST